MDETDVCVIGSGPSGSMAAYELTRLGRETVVLERGPYVPVDRRALGQPPIAPARWDALAETAEGVRPMTPAMVGGAGEIYGAASHRFLPEDFRMRSTAGPVDGADVADWPISYDDLEPYYARAEEIIGVSGTPDGARHPPPRSTPYPLPPLETDADAARRLDEVAARLGLHSQPTPVAILSRPYRGRAPCAACGFCVGFQCRYGARGEPTVTTLRDAADTGRCRIVAGATAHRLVVEDGRAVAVEYSDARGRRGRLFARTFVIAAGAVFTPRLLLLSRSPRFPDGLGNGRGLLGRYFVAHATPMTVGVFADQVHAPNSHYVVRSLDDHYFAAPPRWKGGVLQLHLSGGPPALLRAGVTDPAAIRARLGHEVTMYYCADVLPRAGNRVTLSSRLDRFGVPLPRVEFALHPVDLASSRFGQAESVRLLEAMGAARVITDDAWVTRVGTGFHFSGGCRAAADPGEGVVDADGRVHDSENVYVCDASAFPTSGGFNPTLTIQAFALRVASRIAEAA